MEQALQTPAVSYPRSRFGPALASRLGRLSYPAFSSCLALVLQELGFQDVQLSERRFDRGRTNSAGIDFTASLPTPLGPLRIGGQFKRYDRVRVSRQHLAVLTAATRRRGLAQAVMVATGEISAAARQDAAADDGPPVRLVDGTELARAMTDARVGCVRVTDWVSGEPRYLLDEPFFDRLERQGLRNDPRTTH